MVPSDAPSLTSIAPKLMGRFYAGSAFVITGAENPRLNHCASTAVTSRLFALLVHSLHTLAHFGGHGLHVLLHHLLLFCG